MSGQTFIMHLLKKIPIIIGSILISVTWISCGNAQTNSAKDQVCPDIKDAWNKIKASYQRRNDLARDIANAVKDSEAISDSLLIALAESRMEAMDIVENDTMALTADNIAAFRKIQQKIPASLMLVLMAVEENPDLKKLEGYQKLQSQLEKAENRIAFSTKKYNSAVNDCTTMNETRKKDL
ncbi:MAG TPA: LemA family protein, partial [Chitinophagaceae bacterium]|nr:LemA family protein [Chitinophagaceae bacterium]